MRIGIDGGSWNNRRGYGRFLREIVAALAARNQDHSFVIFLDGPAAENFIPQRGFEVREVPLSRPISEAAGNDGNRSLKDLLRMGRAVAREPLDMFFFPTVYSYFPIWNRVPIVVGIHDTIADRNPRFAFAGKRQEIFWRVKVRMALMQADLVMTVSDYSRRCLHDFYRVPTTRIGVVPEAASKRFIPRDETQREPFILYAGGISPNKNLATLIRAFGTVRPAGWTLRLAGDYESDNFRGCYQELSALVHEMTLWDDVQFLGYVSDEELVRLYQTAGLFILPSLDEGFGLPAIEAMASGAPAIVSNGNSLTEVAGDAALSFDASDSQTLANLIQQAISDPDLRTRMSERGLRRAAEFSWDRSAATLLELFESAARS